MEHPTENTKKIMTIGALIWAALLFAIFALMFPVSQIKIDTSSMFCCGVMAISLAFYSFFRANKYNKPLGVVCLFLATPIFLNRILVPVFLFTIRLRHSNLFPISKWITQTFCIQEASLPITEKMD